MITGDEIWVYGYDPETKMQSSQWKHSSSARPKKAQRVRSKVKVLLTVFFDYRIGVMHQMAKLSTENIICKSSIIFMMQFGARDQSCGPHAIGNCVMIMSRLIHRTWSRGSWPNTAFQLFARLLTLQTWLLVISGCSPNWTDHWRVPILTAARTSCGTERRSWEAFQKCFQQWKERWAKCVESTRGLLRRGSDAFWTGLYSFSCNSS
jgi:hypothetical protein